ncbi:hypothetical protein BOTBODRAFT_31653 [Botryobasidium botryosum FD-172 SS1]|uniref:DUF726-domain-containing protein n=1 Tax=Botryobasidium botryosum (strain FD-172 SS1) TaxID=930990 RepID=A0A067MW30_BOTB1|nr:hypothetical protein BOTBODRAFT_31653 [Botryobasidium botryosum FD-172 SS1]
MSPNALPKPPPASNTHDPFDFDEDDGWQDMPVIREDNLLGLDEEDQKKYHYVAPAAKTVADPAALGNATGNLIDFDDSGNEWRAKVELDEGEYTRLRLEDDDDADEVHLRTKYLFDEDKAMTPLSQMQATKNLLTEAQRIAYVGVCALVTREMIMSIKRVPGKELGPAAKSMELWALKIMGRIYYHMELETAEQKMIESLAEHGVNAMDLAPSLMTTHTVANPEYDPAEAKRKAHEIEEDIAHEPDKEAPGARTPTILSVPPLNTADLPPPSPTNVLTPTSNPTIAGVTTSLSNTDESVTLDIRWTVLCDLFLLLIADSVYDARSRVLLEAVALKLGLGWLDVVKFEKRVTDALEIQEGVEKLEHQGVIDEREKKAKTKRYVMMGLATIGGGLVIGLSAGLLAPVIGAGLGAAFTTIGIGGTTGFLTGAGGAAIITTGGVLTGSSVAGRGMARRTQQVHTFNLLPVHNNKRVSCIIAVPGFMNGPQDDVRLPFSVLDSIVGDVFSVLWEPEMMGETGNALKILTTEVLSSVGTTVLQATVMTGLMSALQWPIILTKLGYLIDNPWSNALDRARAAGLVLADVLLQRHMGVRPITLIGFSLGARVIFYALVELARQKAMGIVQDVFLLGTTVTAPTKVWLEVRGVIAGRFVNGFARNDWILNYLFRATSGGLNTVAGLRPVEKVPGLENVDVTEIITGHLSYRTFMPLILKQIGFPVSAMYFDEPEEPDMEGDRIVVREEEVPKKKKRFSFFSRNKSKTASPSKATPKADAVQGSPKSPKPADRKTPAPVATLAPPPIDDDDGLPERLERPHGPSPLPTEPRPPSSEDVAEKDEVQAPIPTRAGFDFQAIGNLLAQEGPDPSKLAASAAVPRLPGVTGLSTTPERTESAPPLRKASIPDTNPLHSPPHSRSSSLASIDAPSSSAFQTLPATFSRSMSMGPSSIVYAANHPSENEVSIPPRVAEPTFPTWQPPDTGLSFGSSDGSVWTGDTTSSTFGSPFGNTNHKPNAFGSSADDFGFGSSTASLSFGGPNGVISYASPGPLPAAELSFGNADGSISFASSSVDPDPWTPKPIGKKSLFATNPWQT